LDRDQPLVEKILSGNETEEEHDAENPKVEYEKDDRGLNHGDFRRDDLPSFEKSFEERFHDSLTPRTSGRPYGKTKTSRDNL
jgi:hypothetical protein